MKLTDLLRADITLKLLVSQILFGAFANLAADDKLELPPLLPPLVGYYHYSKFQDFLETFRHTAAAP